jgi:hypothetical protein
LETESERERWRDSTDVADEQAHSSIRSGRGGRSRASDLSRARTRRMRGREENDFVDVVYRRRVVGLLEVEEKIA